jgi:hypothetical protein
MFYIVYETINTNNQKLYRGAHKTADINDGYVGSGTILRRAIKKHGIENFETQPLFYAFSQEDMFWAEGLLVDEQWISRSDTYNIKLGGLGGFDHLNSIEGQAYCRKIKLERHGHEHPFVNESNIAKSINTRRKLANEFGWPMLSLQARVKSKETIHQRYGVSNISQIEGVNAKKSQAYINKYGVEWITQSEVIKEKTKNTSLVKYGTLYPQQNKEIQDRIQETRKNRYEINPLHTEESKLKRMQTIRENQLQVGANNGHAKPFNVYNENNELIHSETYNLQEFCKQRSYPFNSFRKSGMTNKHISYSETALKARPHLSEFIGWRIVFGNKPRSSRSRN